MLNTLIVIYKPEWIAAFDGKRLSQDKLSRHATDVAILSLAAAQQHKAHKLAFVGRRRRAK
jgi:hypothetical protein